MPTTFSPAYFELQIRFAHSITRVSSLNLDEALMNYTNIPLQFLHRPFDPSDPLWQEYKEGLQQTSNPGLWTFTFCTRKEEPMLPSPYGCFRYWYNVDNQAISIHFLNIDPLSSGPLSKERMPVRIHELKTMFADIKLHHPGAQTVRGRSWLYNIEAYKRLFPPTYTANVKRIEDDLIGLVIWGQFLRRDGQVREELVASFLSCCAEQNTLPSLLNCFPYAVLEPTGPMTTFYAWYEQDII